MAMIPVATARAMVAISAKRGVTQRASHAALVLAALVVLAVLAAACADFEAPEEPILPDIAITNPSFSADIQPIFTARCSTVSCHNLATEQLGLNLQTGFAYDEIVGRPSRQTLLMLVKPGRPDSSRLVHVLLADAQPRMPLGRAPLTGNQIATIRNWITNGAPRN